MSLQLYTDEVAVLNEDQEWIYRKPIRRSGYWVVRYKGHYRQVMGGIRTPLRLSRLIQGKY